MSITSKFERPKTLLVVFHSPSDNTQKMENALCQGAAKANVDVQLVCKSPFDTQSQDVLSADAIILGTTENLGYMSGALKDFFDRNYYPVIDLKQGLPVAAIIRAGHDGTGTKRALESILTGLKWRWVQEPLVCRGQWKEEFLEQCEDLGMAMAVALDSGMI